ncbi:VWA domain-containing protein [Corynebacterium sp. H128]|uniref:vWA domain-containing protein n=1 Tax=Corynebacterium sp. H128 TaxID=3133427 RepID=UPI0030B182B8
MKRVIVALIAAVGLVACGIENPLSSGDSLKIVTATELKDMEPIIAQASEELGFDIELSYPDGTIANSLALKNGDFDRQYDATWFATNKYVDLYGAGDKLQASTSIATSPIAFGVRADKARELGWNDKQPTWLEVSQAVKDKKFSYGMTDPARSNSGFSALVSVATAHADTGAALQMSDMEKVNGPLRDFFAGQNLTSGSSGWLEEAFSADPQRTDAIVNYESVLLDMKSRMDIEVVVPADGVVTADYPLAALAEPSNDQATAQVAKLGEWLQQHSQQIVDDTGRRPADPNARPLAEHQRNPVIELPFPARQDVADELVFAFANDLRRPAKTVFVLDQSGSMQGDRMQSLHTILTELVDGRAHTATGPVGLRNREEVSIIAFDSEVSRPISGTYSTNNQRQNQPLRDAIAGLVPGGQTAVYDALQSAYQQFPNSEGSIPSIVLMSDGATNTGATFEDFKKFHASLSPERRRIPVFIILYGESNNAEMEALADLTEGKTFDATKGDLGSAFKEIRGYQ